MKKKDGEEKNLYCIHDQATGKRTFQEKGGGLVGGRGGGGETYKRKTMHMHICG